MSDDLVSVVVPSFNYGRFVAGAVESALAQCYAPLEIIVVDDGSTDDTRQRLEPYGDRIRYLYQPNQGLSAARNSGIRAARGGFIALLDADDVWHPLKLAAQMEYLGRHPEVGLLGTELFTDRRDSWMAVGELSRLEAVSLTLDDIVARTCFAPSSVVARRVVLQAAGPFDTSLSCVEDRDMWIRVARHSRIACLPLPLLWYRVHGASLSSKARRMEEHELRVLRRAFEEVPELRGRPLFRRRAFSYAACNAAYMYGVSRSWPAALSRVLFSMASWPWPFRRDEVDVPLARPRMLAVYFLRMLGLLPPDPGEVAATAPTLSAVPPVSPA